MDRVAHPHTVIVELLCFKVKTIRATFGEIELLQIHCVHVNCKRGHVYNDHEKFCKLYSLSRYTSVETIECLR